MRISDFKNLFKKTYLTVEDISNPYGDYYTVKLNIPENVMWTPGEHGAFTIPHGKVKGKKFRAFSIASAPEEGFILIAFRTGDHPSSFKQSLMHLEKGSLVRMHGPVGWFKVRKEKKPMVLIAGGVGITPFRSLLMAMKGKNIPAELIYTSRDFHLFEDDIQGIVQGQDSIRFRKSSNHSESAEYIQKAVDTYQNDAIYYISGSLDFIKSVKKDLKQKGVKGKNMINDPFFGY